MENRKSVEALHIDREGSGIRMEWTAREFPLTIMLNGEQLVTVLCSPGDLKALAAGFLFSEGMIRAKEEITGLTLDGERGIIRIRTATDKTADGKLFMKRVLTTGCGRGMAFYSYADLDRKKKIRSDLRVTPAEVLALNRRFQGASELYRTTHGVHSAALCDNREILVFAEDIGRHNAVDKVLGRCLLEGIAVSDRILVTSGRISSEILFKAAGSGIPVIVSKSAPTDMGVELARELGITLIGFVRGGGMNVYAGEERINLAGKMGTAPYFPQEK
ncbi:MAG: formate dehydrogenase accessory sulfurtransferase FdhD [Proteobacteria bacterium]|nr:formate dehydrogenase accessory sulfurtransferase FdhD [Pseudomonadota bacterium]